MFGTGEGKTVKSITPAGIAILLAMVAGFIIVYSLYYPLKGLGDTPLLSVIFHDAFGVLYFALTLLGLGLIFVYRKNITSRLLLVSGGFSIIIWLAIQSKYWYYGWTPYIPFYDPTFHALETFVMTLGALAMLKSHDVVDSKLAKGNAPGALKSIATGVTLGIPFAVVNALIYVFVYGDTITAENVLYQCVVALQPGILEEAAYRLLLMSVALVVLLRYLPKRAAVISAIAMAVIFHAAVHVPDLIVSQPLMAFVTIAIMSLVFGLPMALLAYKKDIESAIGFHWVIDAIRFTLGLG